MTRRGSALGVVVGAVGVLAAGVVVGGAGAALLGPTASAQEQQPGGAGAGGGGEGEPQRGRAAGAQDMGGMLVRALQSIDGCLKADAAQWSNGQVTIAAWFEDKEAAMRWYRSATHQMMLRMAGGGSPEPMEHTPDGVPLLVMATMTFTDRPKIEGIPLPIEQISIELFQTAPGGASINGRLSPASFPVEHLREIDMGGGDAEE